MTRYLGPTEDKSAIFKCNFPVVLVPRWLYEAYLLVCSVAIEHRDWWRRAKMLIAQVPCQELQGDGLERAPIHRALGPLLQRALSARTAPAAATAAASAVRTMRRRPRPCTARLEGAVHGGRRMDFLHVAFLDPLHVQPAWPLCLADALDQPRCGQERAMAWSDTAGFTGDGNVGKVLWSEGGEGTGFGCSAARGRQGGASPLRPSLNPWTKPART